MIKRVISSILIMVIACTTVFSVSSFAETNTSETHPSRVVDNADLLTDSQEADLLKKLDEISERQEFDVVVVTVKSTDGQTTEAYADDFYDYNGYGMGTNRDGVLLLVSEQADFRGYYHQISTRGLGIKAFSGEKLDEVADDIKPLTESGNYTKAFNDFADYADDFATEVKSFKAGKKLLISLAIGLVLALIVVFSMKSQLKSVRQKANASDYTKQGSLNITQSKDMFIYRHVDRKKKPERDSSNTHTSSSGATHGGKSF